MRTVKGAKQHSIRSITNILFQTHTFTCCMLPHYRYDSAKRACMALQNKGFIEKSGKTQVGTCFKTTKLFQEWKEEILSGKTNRYPIKWLKAKKALDN